jgi:hypothetical protein
MNPLLMTYHILQLRCRPSAVPLRRRGKLARILAGLLAVLPVKRRIHESDVGAKKTENAK